MKKVIDMTEKEIAAEIEFLKWDSRRINAAMGVWEKFDDDKCTNRTVNFYNKMFALQAEIDERWEELQMELQYREHSECQLAVRAAGALSAHDGWLVA